MIEIGRKVVPVIHLDPAFPRPVRKKERRKEHIDPPVQEKAVPYRDKNVRVPLAKSGSASFNMAPDGILVIHGLMRDDPSGRLLRHDAGKKFFQDPFLDPDLVRIGGVKELASAAKGIIGAGGIDPFRRGLFDLFRPRETMVLSRRKNANRYFFSRQDIGDKKRHSLPVSQPITVMHDLFYKKDILQWFYGQTVLEITLSLWNFRPSLSAMAQMWGEAS